MIPAIDLSQPKGAVFSEDGLYRYLLIRVWRSLPEKLLLFNGLNASTGNGRKDDATIARLTYRAYTSGYDGLLCTNLAALVSKEPAGLFKTPDPIGPLNDEYIKAALALTGGAALLGWGQLIKGVAFLEKRADAVIKMVREPYCLGKTQDGYPKHPLYVAYSVPIQKY